MKGKSNNLTKEQIENSILPSIVKNKKGFSSGFEMTDIFKSIVHKLKTGCQWKFLFVDIESFSLHIVGKWFIITIEMVKTRSF